jgi:hypothetical protein
VAAAQGITQKWRSHFDASPAVRERFGHYGNWELPLCIDLGVAAANFVREGHKQDGAFAFHLHKSLLATAFPMMFAIGFFERVDDHYRMVPPRELSVELMMRSMMQLLETEDVDPSP